ncbi:hypothetical protein BV25DRAFT_1809718, partial [Artomyces pyxidatus]
MSVELIPVDDDLGPEFSAFIARREEILGGPRKLQRAFAPIPSAYVVFTLDPVATLECLNDSLAISQAQQLSVRQYVGCLVQSGDLPSPYLRYNTGTCIFLSQDLPQASPSEGIDETMCVSIAPAQHPTGRPAVVSSPPLPWDNLYHHTQLAVQLRLTPKAGDYSSCPLLSEDDIFNLNICFAQDITRRKELVRIYRS